VRSGGQPQELACMWMMCLGHSCICHLCCTCHLCCMHVCCREARPRVRLNKPQAAALRAWIDATSGGKCKPATAAADRVCTATEQQKK
jgi:hypothetical protein